MTPKAISTVFMAAGILLAASTVAQAAAQTNSDPLQAARGAKAWADNCGRCHNLRSPAEYSDNDIEVAVTHMRVRANLPGNVAEDIKAFLKASN